MSSLSRALFAFAILASFPEQASPQGIRSRQPGSREIVIGTSLEMPSEVLNASIELAVALPADYDESVARYPVLFAFQSPLLASVSGLAGVLAYAGVAPPMIVVSVGFDGSWFSLYSDEAEPGSDRGGLVLQCIRDELVHFIEARYRTAPYRIFLGHSSSSLFLLHAMLAEPDVMNAVFAAGPMFAEFDYARVAGMLEGALAKRPARTQFLFYTQGDQPELTRDLTAYGEWLTARRPAGLTWKSDPEPEANHGSLQVKTLYDGLRILYADWAALPEEVALGGAAAIRAYKKELATRFGYDIGLGPLAHMRLRTKWIAEGNFEALVALARLATEERPDDVEAERGLAVAYEQAGRWEEAAAAWERCVAKAKAHRTPEELERVLPRLEARRDAARRKIRE